MPNDANAPEPPATPKQVRVGLIGFGEVGSALGGGLRAAGLSQVAAYDTGAASGPFAELIRQRAAAAEVRLVDSLAELVATSEVLIGLTPGSRSLAVAQELSTLLTDGQVYGDFASCAPSVKLRVAELLEACGAGIVDGAIVSTALIDRSRTRVLVSGTAVRRLTDLLSPWGPRLESVGDKVGTASLIKSLRSVVTKGNDALIVECLVASERYGVRDEVVRCLSAVFDQRPFAEFINKMVVSGAIHSSRRAEEADMSAETLRAVGVEPIMTRSSAARLRWVAGLGLDQHFGGVPPASYLDVLAAIDDHPGS